LVAVLVVVRVSVSVVVLTLVVVDVTVVVVDEEGLSVMYDAAAPPVQTKKLSTVFTLRMNNSSVSPELKVTGPPLTSISTGVAVEQEEPETETLTPEADVANVQLLVLTSQMSR